MNFPLISSCPLCDFHNIPFGKSRDNASPFPHSYWEEDLWWRRDTPWPSLCILYLSIMAACWSLLWNSFEMWIRRDMTETSVDFTLRFTTVCSFIDQIDEDFMYIIEETLGDLMEQVWCKGIVNIWKGIVLDKWKGSLITMTFQWGGIVLVKVSKLVSFFLTPWCMI